MSQQCFPPNTTNNGLKLYIRITPIQPIISLYPRVDCHAFIRYGMLLVKENNFILSKSMSMLMFMPI